MSKRKTRGPRNKDLVEFRALMRRLVADYMESEGCSCCRRPDHAEHGEALARALNVPQYEDGSGWDFRRYRTEAPN